MQGLNIFPISSSEDEADNDSGWEEVPVLYDGTGSSRKKERESAGIEKK